MRGIYRFVILALTSVLFFQCQRELSNIGSGDQGQVVTPSPITANIQGNIFDENGQAAAGVIVKVGAKSATTDSKGFFKIANASLDKNQSLVTAEKAGYFKAMRSFAATSGANQVVIKLIKRNLAGTVNGASGGDATLSNGTKISLPANGIVKASDNSAYTGTVNVYAAYIDPTSSDILQTVPGSFMANDKDGKRVILSSYGMMAVELESASGEKLQIKSGSTATLTSPIPSASQGIAPSSIPLWYVDEATGLWKEEGSATKQGNNYVGTVKHFTYWNCDMSLQTINFTATLHNADGQPLVHASVVVKPATGNYWGYAHGYTDSLGQASGPIPANMNLVLEVLDPCGGVIYSQNIGPFSQNVNLGTITISGGSSTIGVLTVKGHLLTCSNTNVVDGYAIVTLGYMVHYAAVTATGDFSTNFIVCSGTTGNVQVLGVDATAQQQSTAASFTVTSPVTNVGNITACGTSSAQFINYTIDGTSYNVTAPADSLIGYTTNLQGTTLFTTSITGMQGAGNNFLNFQFSSATAAPGTYPITQIAQGNAAGVANPGINVTVTNFPTTIGGFYEGSFSGTYVDAQTVTHTINCTFRVRRNF